MLENFDSVLAGTTNELGMMLLEELYVDGENIFFSPLGIATALAMTYNGARGETREDSFVPDQRKGQSTEAPEAPQYSNRLTGCRNLTPTFNKVMAAMVR